MSNTTAQDCDPESLEHVLLNTENHPKYRWHRIFLLLRVQIALSKRGTIDLLRALSSSSSHATLDTHDGGEITEIPEDVSVQIISHDYENQNQSDDQIVLDRIARMVKEKNLDSLNELGGVQGIRTHLENRMQGDRISLCQSRPNTSCSTQSPDQSFFYFLFKACNSSTTFLLLLCAAVSLGFGIQEEGPEDGWYDGVTIFLSVFIIVSVTSVGNCLRARKLRKLSKKKKLLSEVVRDGQPQNISVSDVMVGDIICLTRGDQIPADGLFVDGEALLLDDMPNSIIDDLNPFVFSGTEVIEGHGRMLVTSVGKNTALGEIMSLVNAASNGKTLLEARLAKINTCTQIIALLISILLLVVLFLRYKLGKMDAETGYPEVKGKPTAIREFMNAIYKIMIKPKGTIRILTTSLTVLLVGLQEGFSFVVALSIVLWNKKAESSKATVQEFSACVTMGSVTAICIDNIDGLISNKMEVVMFRIGEEIVTEETLIHPDVREALCHGIGTPVHSSVDDSLLPWARSKFGMQVETLKQSCTIVQAKQLKSGEEGCVLKKKKKSEHNEKNMCLHWKGPAATILDMCSHYYNSKGAKHFLDEQRRVEFQRMIGDMGIRGLKIIALAYKQIDVASLEENNLILIGLLGLKRKPLEKTIRAMEDFRSAGVNIKLVSGDDVALLETVAREYEMHIPNTEIMILESQTFRDLTDEEKKQIIDHNTAMGNALPSDRLLLVKCLRQNGHVVAVLGARTNDAPSLKEADVGLTMEAWSTKMARESSAIIIHDDSFSCLVRIMRCGRCAYYNIQKFIQLELTTTIAGLLLMTIMTMFLGDAPVTTIQLLWANLIVAILGGLALLTEPGAEKLLDKPPVGRSEPLITIAMWRNTIFQALYQAAILVTFQLKGQAILRINDEVCKVIIFNSFVLCQLFNQVNAREPETKNIFRGIHHNPWFWVAVIVSVVLQVAFIEIAHTIAGNAKLNRLQWSICFLIGIVSWAIDWAVKYASGLIMEWLTELHSSHGGSICLTPPASNLELPLINVDSIEIQS